MTFHNRIQGCNISCGRVGLAVRRQTGENKAAAAAAADKEAVRYVGVTAPWRAHT